MPGNEPNTTLGDLIIALTDEAARLSRNKKESYRLAAAALSDLLECSPDMGRPGMSGGGLKRRHSRPITTLVNLVLIP